MLTIMDKGEFDDGKGLKFSYAHPLFWAPFTLVGDG
jgi:CHAT domain-containing protein